MICFGSYNLDDVFQVAAFVRGGETIPALGYSQHLGGKGLNQTIALKRAGVDVRCAGHIGPDGESLRMFLRANDVDDSLLRSVDTPTGRAIIQVNSEGDNCIIYHGGANRCVTVDYIDQVVNSCTAGEWLLLQNEVNALPEILNAAHKRGLRIALNPSPLTDDLLLAPLDVVRVFVLNEIEGAWLTGFTIPEEILSEMANRYPNAAVVLTLGEEGAWFVEGEVRYSVPALCVNAVDTTAAGDTFTGYFLAEWSTGTHPKDALTMAAMAAGISVTRPGAAESIPTLETVRSWKVQG